LTVSGRSSSRDQTATSIFLAWAFLKPRDPVGHHRLAALEADLDMQSPASTSAFSRSLVSSTAEVIRLE